ncbi:MAG: hypothetical protein J2P58_15100 [Acidimicrobiaceae bacterium]|nr:hypothetical protein [Acidimicrobiaceae bacterium]MBO0747378.1 hypothetical protein [Acidimicrobiaceae bacterium]
MLAEGLEPYAVAEVWIMSHDKSDRVVDVTDLLQRKLAALRCHASQETDRDGRLEERMRAWMGGNARAGGLGGDRLAESFRSFATA